MMFVTLKLYWIIFIPLIVMSLSQALTNVDDMNNNTDIKNIEEDENDKDYTFLVIGGYRPKKHILSKYIVSLRAGRSKRFDGDNHFCGGSIIKSNVILTAAHCIVDRSDRPIPQMTAVAGSPFLIKSAKSAKSYAIDKVLPHPVFSHSTMRSDVGLAFLSEHIQLDAETASIVPLVDAKPESGWSCVSFGWGRIFPGGPRPVELVYVNLTLMKRSECSDYYPMNPAVICAADAEDAEKGVWKGDSGGPLLCDGKLTGIVSFGYPKNDAPSYFSNVYEHRKWILENTGRRIHFPFRGLLYFYIVNFFLVLCFHEL